VIRVEYMLDDLPDGAAIDIKEDRGHIVFRIGRDLKPQQMVDALNAGAAAILAGGHWFQEWKGDIIAADPQASIPPQPPGTHDAHDPTTTI
jgi:hypothetical protein